MKIFHSTTILAATSALLMAATAGAAMPASSKDVVKNANGRVWVNSFNNCVRTKWDSDHEGCNVASLEMRTVYFDFNSSSLTAASKEKLNGLAAALKQGGVNTIKIVGFADEIGSDGYNTALSTRRANSAAHYLRNKGIKVAGKYEVRGLGETSSQSDCAGKTGQEQRACLWRDRRVEIEVVE
jgi:OOP family OmpA-OmpF porin